MSRGPVAVGAVLALLVLPRGVPGQDGSPGPLRLEEVQTLVETRVSPGDLATSARRRGVSFPPTPAIRRFLRQLGLSDDGLDRLWPVPSEADRTAIEGSGLTLVLAAGWNLEPMEKGWRLEKTRAPPRMAVEGRLAVHPLDPQALRGGTPGLRTVQDLLRQRAEPVLDQPGVALTSLRPLPARGITGAQLRLVRDETGKDRSVQVLAAFTRRQTLLTIDVRLQGPADDPFIEDAERELAMLLSSVATGQPEDQLTGRPVEDPRTHILVIEEVEGTRRLRLLRRDGDPVEEFSDAGVDALLGDPLALRVGWRRGARLHELRSGAEATDKSGAEPLPARNDSLRLLPGRSGIQTEVWNSKILVDGGERFRGADGAVDPEGRTFAWAEPAERASLVLARFDLGDHVRHHSDGPSFRPAHRVDVAEDPGSDHWLVAVAGTYHPLPFPDAGPPQTVVRFLYVPKKGGEQRPLLFRQRPGEDAEVPRSPRFLPSAWEVLYIDPELGLCVIPRDGGLPVQLRPGVVAAEPWIDTR